MPHIRKNIEKKRISIFYDYRLVVLFSIISGSCGLGYEVIYIRLFSNYFGNAFVISAALLTAIFLGISFGAFFAHKFVGKLGLIEILIGLYSVLVAFFLTYNGFSIVSFWGQNEYLNAFKLYIFLIPPTFLIGCCVPLFSEYVRFSRENTRKQGDYFTLVYSLYNFGAVLSIILVEFFLFRYLGVFKTVLILGIFNIITGAYLFIGWDKIIKSPKKTPFEITNKKIFIILFAISFSSGVFQLLSLQIVSAIFGPLKENFAIILISAISGVASGAFLFRFLKPKLQTVLQALLLTLSSSFIGLGAGVEIWSVVLLKNIGVTYELLLKLSLIFIFSFPFFTLLGMVVPLVVRELQEGLSNRDNSRIGGVVLAISSLANGLGALSYILYFHQNFSIWGIAVFLMIILFLSLSAYLFNQKQLKSVIQTGFINLVLWATVITIWPGQDLLFGYKAIADYYALNYHRKHFLDVQTYKAADQDASLIYLDDGTHSLVFNGYQSLTFGKELRSDLHEAMVGAAPALFTQRTQNAMVFGLGTGISAGSTVALFDHVKTVEINKAILNIPQHFKKQNFGLLDAPNSEIKIEDGITSLLLDDKKYDAIINTVTSPQYFSAIKMYTADFYKIVSQSLSENGVYSSWFDVNIGVEGISIMLNTLEKSFDRCRYFLMSIGYFNVVCANNQLTLLPDDLINDRFSKVPVSQVMQSKGFFIPYSVMIKAIEIDFGKDFFERSSSSINTLDRPLIEFVGIDNLRQFEAGNELKKTVERNLAILALLGQTSREKKHKCSIMQYMINQTLDACS